MWGRDGRSVQWGEGLEEAIGEEEGEGAEEAREG